MTDSDVGLVAGGVQEQAEDILVPLLLRNCLTCFTFPFLVIISLPLRNSGPCNSFYCLGHSKMFMMMMMMSAVPLKLGTSEWWFLVWVVELRGTAGQNICKTKQQTLNTTSQIKQTINHSAVESISFGWPVFMPHCNQTLLPQAIVKKLSLILRADVHCSPN